MTQPDHESTVLYVLNFLNAVGAPIRHRDGTKDHIWGIRERIRWVRERLHRITTDNQRFASKLDAVRRPLEQRVDDLERVVRIVGEILTSHVGDSVAEALMMVECAMNPGKSLHSAEEIRAGSGIRDDNGVARVRVDVRDALLELGANSVIHDLDKDEIVCANCKGLGIVKGSSRYGKGGAWKYTTGESVFPYTHQYFGPCPVCYSGKIKVCLEEAADGGRCLRAIPRGRTVCDCAAAREKQSARREAREQERQSKLPRVALSSYDQPMLFAYHTDRFVEVDEVDEVLEEQPDEVFFAVTPSVVATRTTAEEVIEKIVEVAYDNSGDSDMVEFADGAATELDALLEEWFAKNVSFRAMYYVDNRTIVEVGNVG